MSRLRLRILAPAKLNLGLKVLGQRPDGFHEIVTTFVAVDLFDQLTFTKCIAGGTRLILTNSGHQRNLRTGFPLGEGNLILRAVRLVESATGLRFHLSIAIDKQIPLAAGLGGGSSDAAATLRALVRLYRISASREQVASWAAELGSDVPFFLGGPAAEGRGRGEKLRPINLYSGWWAVLICPSIFLSAKDVYDQIGLTSSWRFSSFDRCRDGEGFFATMRRTCNDLETVVIRRVPAVLYWQERLREIGAKGVFVSGSGPTVFGVFEDRPSESAIRTLTTRSDGAHISIVRPLASPSALVEA